MNKKDGDDEEDSDDGSGGSAGGATRATGVWYPNYFELLGLSGDEKELNALASQALFEQRISLKAQGHEVSALSKMQKLRNRMQEPGLDNSPGASSGTGLEAHPELAEMGGDVDPNIIVLPESEAAERASNDPQLELKLRARMAMKFGMGGDMSLQAMKENYEKKMRMRAAPTPSPEPQPRYVFSEPAPTFVPPKPRPY